MLSFEEWLLKEYQIFEDTLSDATVMKSLRDKYGKYVENEIKKKCK